MSHRFSTVRMTDQIAVADGGTLTEVGRYYELIDNDSFYAELYEVQSRGYR